jgi:hypothetical protein
MRYKIFAVAAILASTTAMAQPPKKKQEAPPVKQPIVGSLVVNDTLVEKTDTFRVQYRVWTGGNDIDYTSYLTRVNGFLIKIAKVGKVTSQEPSFRYFDWRWKELRPEELEAELTKRVDWK